MQLSQLVPKPSETPLAGLEPSEALYQVQQQQRQDPEELARLYSFLKIRTLPEDPQLAKVITNFVRKDYFFVDDVLYYEVPDVPDQRRVVVTQHLRGRIINENHDAPDVLDRGRVVVTQHLRGRIIDENHDATYSGHFAVKKVTQRISQYFYWSGMRGDIYKKCSGCVTCTSSVDKVLVKNLH